MTSASQCAPKGANRESQRGFTLIEMSIVLVIIGLIIGGILKGQELVNSARLKAQVAQIDAVKSAVYTFQDKYGFLPGDYAANTALNLKATTDGDQNGAIAHGGANVLDTAAADGEGLNVWLQLASAGFVSGETLQGTAVLSTATSAWMPGKVNGTSGVDYLVLQTFTSNTQTANMVRLQGVDPTKAPTGNALRVGDAVTIDQKYDDGAPTTGSILSSGSSQPACLNGGTGYNANLTGTAPVCDLMFVVN